MTNRKKELSGHKPAISLIDPEFILGMARVLTDGASKYKRDNWKKCKDKTLYQDAALRHLLADMQGEEFDKESGESHLYHAACNLMFLAWYESNGK